MTDDRPPTTDWCTYSSHSTRHLPQSVIRHPSELRSSRADEGAYDLAVIRCLARAAAASGEVAGIIPPGRLDGSVPESRGGEFFQVLALFERSGHAPDVGLHVLTDGLRQLAVHD